MSCITLVVLIGRGEDFFDSLGGLATSGSDEIRYSRSKRCCITCLVEGDTGRGGGLGDKMVATNSW